MLNSPVASVPRFQLKFVLQTDCPGSVLYLLGIIVETIADAQKLVFRDDPHNDLHWCDFGKLRMGWLKALLVLFILSLSLSKSALSLDAVRKVCLSSCEVIDAGDAQTVCVVCLDFLIEIEM